MVERHIIRPSAGRMRPNTRLSGIFSTKRKQAGQHQHVDQDVGAEAEEGVPVARGPKRGAAWCGGGGRHRSSPKCWRAFERKSELEGQVLCQGRNGRGARGSTHDRGVKRRGHCRVCAERPPKLCLVRDRFGYFLISWSVTAQRARQGRSASSRPSRKCRPAPGSWPGPPHGSAGNRRRSSRRARCSDSRDRWPRARWC